MSDLKVDFVLKAKGESKLLSLGALSVALRWRGDLDLDLMAFYKRKNGEVGGVFSTNYLGGDLGRLNAFPFMELSGDELEATQGVAEERMRIERLDELEQLYLVALNYSDASQQRARSFSHIDVQVNVTTNRGETFQVPLTDPKAGVVALLCRIDNTNRVTGPQLINEARVMSLDELYREVPGAQGMQVSQKIVLRAKGEVADLKRSHSDAPIHATLRWRAAVDLDLHCFYLPKGSLGSSGPVESFFDKLFGASNRAVKHIYFGERGDLERSPFIELDHDAGIGDEGGDNEENIEIASTRAVDAVLFAANIFNKPNAHFGSYDGLVSVRCGTQEVEAPLTSATKGAWAWIALIDCRSEQLKVIQIDEVCGKEPTSADFKRLLKARRSS